MLGYQFESRGNKNQLTFISSSMNLKIRILFLWRYARLSLLRLANCVLARLPDWRLFDRVRAWFFSIQQAFLRRELNRLYVSMPPLGLYGHRPKPKEFRAFCAHVLAVFLRSPRCKLLTSLNAQLQLLTTQHEDVRCVLDSLKQFILLRQFINRRCMEFLSLQKGG